MGDAGDRRQEALGWARSARDTRHGVRRALSSGSTDLDGVLRSAELDPFLGAVRVLWVLESLPGARKTDTRRALARLAIDGGLPLAALTDAQRGALRTQFGPAAVTA